MKNPPPHSSRVILALALAIASAGLGTRAAQAQSDYPARPVTLIVPFAPGGGTDISARTLAARVGSKWGKSVLVENRGGAGGILGAEVVAKAKPDGYTLLMGQGAVPQSSTPRELQALIDSDLARYGRIIREKNLKAE